ncbi:MAG: tetratricopeptide repeat protein, partial [Planctomycetota bacterium]
IIGEFLRWRPDDHVGLVNLGVALRAGGRPAAGLRHLERAVQVNPDYTKAWVQLAQTYEALGDTDAAIGAYREVLARWPNYGRAQRKLQELRAGG